MSGDGSQRRRPVRIAYLAHGVNGRHDGVRTKILAQAEAWSKRGAEVEVGVFVRCEAGAEADWAMERHVVGVRSSQAGIVGRLVARERLSLDLWRWAPDVVYLRQSTVSPSLVVLATRLPTVVELNTLDLRELRMQSPVRYRYAAATRRLLLTRARALVAVSSDIAEHATVRALGVPVETIPNGIDLEAVPALAPSGNRRPTLAFLGSPGNPWHGLDKIIRLAHAFPDWRFEIVGPTAADVGTHPPNVFAHGPLLPAAYRPILAGADVAIGSLALHRVGLDSASPLKVGEYLAYGLPTIIGYRDSRFPEGAPFLLSVPNTEAGVAESLDAIRHFALTWVGRRVPRSAIAAVDVRLIEERRVDLLLDAAASRGR